MYIAICKVSPLAIGLTRIIKYSELASPTLSVATSVQLRGAFSFDVVLSF